MLFNKLRFEGTSTIPGRFQINLAFAGLNRLAGFTVLTIGNHIIGEVTV